MKISVVPNFAFNFVCSFVCSFVMMISILGMQSRTIFAATPEEVMDSIQRARQSAGVEIATEAVPLSLVGDRIMTETDHSNFDLSIPKGQVLNTTTASLVQGEGESQIVFQQTDEGSHRASIYIGSPSDPERYEFEVIGAHSLIAQEDGSLLAADENNVILGQIAAPWAKDAQGKDVPTHFEVEGTKVFQVVEHRSGDYAYGIVADPSFLDDVWHTFKRTVRCGAALAALIPAGKALKALKELGGVEKTIELMSRAKNLKGFLHLGGGAAVTLIGITDIKNNCF